MSVPEGFTEEEWASLSPEEQNGILEIDESEDLDALKEIAGEHQEDAANVPEAPAEEAEAVAEEPAGTPELAPEVAALIEQNRLLMEKLTALSKGTEEPASDVPADPPAAFDFQDAYKRQAEALTEGDTGTYAQIGAEIENARIELSRQVANEVVSANQADIMAWNAVDAVIAAAHKEYPFLDLDAKDAAGKSIANQQAVDMVVAVRNGYLAQGIPMAQAIAKAVDQVGPLFRPRESQPAPSPRPSASQPDVVTLGSIPQEQGEDTSGNPWAKLDALQGEEYEAALERLTPAQRDAYLAGT
jgi:acyl-CoA-binding protein